MRRLGGDRAIKRNKVFHCRPYVDQLIPLEPYFEKFKVEFGGKKEVVFGALCSSITACLSSSTVSKVFSRAIINYYQLMDYDLPNRSIEAFIEQERERTAQKA